MSASTSNLRKRKIDEKPILRIRDDVPVKNIFIPNILKTINKKTIFQHFEKFGKVESVKMIYGRTRSDPIRCIISFSEASSAYGAFVQRIHYVGYEHFQVLPCPSWEQPFNGDVVFPSSRLLTVNDYCLAAVYPFLDLRTQVRLASLHSRLEDVFTNMVGPHLVKLILNDINTFSLWEAHQFLRMAGRFVRTIEVQSFRLQSVWKVPDAIVYDFMREFCSKVCCLRVLCQANPLNKFLASLNPLNITEVELCQCGLSDTNLVELRGLRNLRSLGLARNPNMFCEDFPRFGKLKRLSLYGCLFVNRDSLINILKASKLVYLDIRMSTLDSIVPIIEHGQSLETLRLWRLTRSDFHGLLQLPKLKSLHVHSYMSIMPPTFYTNWVDQQCDNITELKLTGLVGSVSPSVVNVITRFDKLRVLWLHQNMNDRPKELIEYVCTLSELEELNIPNAKRIHGKHVLSVLRQCTKLKRLGLRSCKHIDDRFVLEAIQILKNRTNKPEEPVLIMASDTRVSSSILSRPEYLDASDVLQLLFPLDVPMRGLLDERSDFEIGNNQKCIDPVHTMYSYEDDDYSDSSMSSISSMGSISNSENED